MFGLSYPHRSSYNGIRVLQAKGVDLMHLTSLNECNSMGFIAEDVGGLILHIVERWSQWAFSNPRMGLLYILDSSYDLNACISTPFSIFLHALLHAPMFISFSPKFLFYVLCFSFPLYTLYACLCLLCHGMSYVHGYAYDYDILCTCFRLMTHTLYSLSQHHLTSILFQSDLAECGFSKSKD